MARSLVIASQSISAAPGGNIAVQAELRDGATPEQVYGKPTIALKSGPAGAVIGGSLAATMVDGVATWAVTGDRKGSYVFTVSADEALVHPIVHQSPSLSYAGPVLQGSVLNTAGWTNPSFEIAFDWTPNADLSTTRFLIDSRNTGITGGIFISTQGTAPTSAPLRAIVHGAGVASTIASANLTWTMSQKYRIRVVVLNGVCTIYRDGVSVASGSVTSPMGPHFGYASVGGSNVDFLTYTSGGPLENIVVSTPVAPSNWLFEYGKSGVAMPTVGGVAPVAVTGANSVTWGPTGSHVKAPAGQNLSIEANAVWPLEWAGEVTFHTVAWLPPATWTAAPTLRKADVSDVLYAVPQFNGAINYGVNGASGTGAADQIKLGRWSVLSVVRSATQLKTYADGVLKNTLAVGAPSVPTRGDGILFRSSADTALLGATLAVPSAQSDAEVLAQARAWGLATTGMGQDIACSGWSSAAGTISFRYVPWDGTFASAAPNRMLFDGRGSHPNAPILYVWWNGDVTVCVGAACASLPNPGWVPGTAYDFVFQWTSSNIYVTRNGSVLFNVTLAAPPWGNTLKIGADKVGTDPARGTISSLVTPTATAPVNNYDVSTVGWSLTSGQIEFDYKPTMAPSFPYSQFLFRHPWTTGNDFYVARLSDGNWLMVTKTTSTAAISRPTTVGQTYRMKVTWGGGFTRCYMDGVEFLTRPELPVTTWAGSIRLGGDSESIAPIYGEISNFVRVS